MELKSISRILMRVEHVLITLMAAPNCVTIHFSLNANYWGGGKYYFIICVPFKDILTYVFNESWRKITIAT